MPSHFTLRMQFAPHEDPEEVKGWLLGLADRAPVDEIMVFFFGEEYNTGHPTPEEIAYWIERTRPWRQALRERGVQLSLNIWQTLLHRDNTRTLQPGQHWQTMVDAHGTQAAAVVCPLDPGWRAYYLDLLRAFGPEGFRVYWVEDDFRLHNHAPLEWGGCFCPLHVAEFNRRTGLSATREEIVANCTAPGEPHPWRAQWMDLWDDTLCEVIASWRQVVEANGSRLGLMSSWPEAHAAEGRDWAKWWRALAGDKPPIHRPGYWGYSDQSGPDLPGSIALYQENRQVEPPGTEIGPEIECFTYGRWHKSLRQTGAQMALGHVLGAKTLNISIYDFLGNRPDDDDARADFLRRWRPVCDRLTVEFSAELKSVGIGIPWTQEMGRRVHTERAGDWSGAGAPWTQEMDGRRRAERSGDWRALTVPHRQWAPWLGGLGQAFAMGAQPEVNALAGPVTWAFTEEELRDWLSRGVLLDPTAAEILVARGLGDLIGVRSGRWITQRDALYVYERTSDPAFGLHTHAMMSLNLTSGLWQADLVEGVRVVSTLHDPRQRVVGHGLCLFQNSQGGRVALIPWKVTDPFYATSLTVQRWAQLTKAIDWLAQGRSLGRAEGGPWLVPQFLTDGLAWRGVIWNASPDEISEFTVHVPQAMGQAREAAQLTAGGVFLPAEVRAGRVRTAEPVGQWGFVMVK